MQGGRGPILSRHQLNRYRIEKVRCPVTVVLADGEMLAGEIFLNQTSRFRAEPQEPEEFLHEEEAWFALASPEGVTRLIAKGSVESVDVPLGGADATDAPPPHPVGVQLRLASGADLTGTVMIDTPPSRARLVDFLNSHRERFICLVRPDRMTLVNRHAIVHVRELS